VTEVISADDVFDQTVDRQERQGWVRQGKKVFVIESAFSYVAFKSDVIGGCVSLDELVAAKGFDAAQFCVNFWVPSSTESPSQTTLSECACALPCVHARVCAGTVSTCVSE